MFYIRREGIDPIRQGFNFYPWWSASVGCQMLFWRLRIEVRFNKKQRKVRIGWWLTQPVEHEKESMVYIPGYTEEMKKLYEKQNKYWDKKYEDWEHDPELEKQREREQAERNRIRDEERAKQRIESESNRWNYTDWVK